MYISYIITNILNAKNSKHQYRYASTEYVYTLTPIQYITPHRLHVHNTDIHVQYKSTDTIIQFKNYNTNLRKYNKNTRQRGYPEMREHFPIKSRNTSWKSLTPNLQVKMPVCVQILLKYNIYKYI